ncbi:MAG: restriction endonuclease subunit S, partial [Chitinophagales bacterium]|nr:restriction endonuclease subunit S [Chitinophagales bacterium]
MKQGWEIKRLVEVCKEITDGSHFSPKSYDEGAYPYITVRDIDEDIIDFKNCKFIKKNDYLNLLKNGCKPNEGDLLFSKDGTVGKVTHVDFEKEFVVLSSLAIIRPKSEIIYSPFLKYILKDPAFLNEAIGRKTGVAIKRIILRNLEHVREFERGEPGRIFGATKLRRYDKTVQRTDRLPMGCNIA